MNHSVFSQYTQCTDIINYNDIHIQNLAIQIHKKNNKSLNTIQKLFEYVRDEIKHTFDINGKIITCRASEVLQHKHGICYAKSHLLAALLRFLNIPCGLGYQQITSKQNPDKLVLHGYNYVFLKDYNKWIKLDARGNTNGINVQFSVDRDNLAFPVRMEKNERDENINHINPKENVIKALLNSQNMSELRTNLPQNF